MPNIDLGILTINPGTPQQLTANLSVPSQNLYVHSYMVQTFGATAGDAYVGRSGLDRTAATAMPKIYSRIPKASAAVVNFFSATCARVNESFDLSHVYMDGDGTGDKFLVSAISAVIPLPQDP